MRVFALADLHLSPYIWASERRIVNDSYAAFMLAVKKIITQADSESVVVLAGDIFDAARTDTYTEYIFKYGITQLLNAGIPVYAIQGNHDFNNKLSRATLFGAKQLGTAPVSVHGIKICGIDYVPTREKLLTQLANIPECDLLVLHAPAAHLLSIDDKWQLQAEDIPEYVKCVVIGDIHKRHTLDTGNTLIISPGSTHPRKTTEFTADWGFAVIDFLEDISVDFTDVLVRHFIRYEVKQGQENEFRNYLEKIPVVKENTPAPVINVRYNKEQEAVIKPIMSSREDIFFIETVTVGDAEITAAESSLETVISLEEALEQSKDTVSTAVYNFLNGLFGAAEPAEFIKEYFEKENVSYA